jgi:hypothetical protein
MTPKLLCSKLLIPIALSCSLITGSGCANKLITKDFDSTKKIQVIPVSKEIYIYAQNDSLLNSTLEKEIAKMDPDWEKQIKIYNKYMTIAHTGLAVQLLTLVACLSVHDIGPVLGWCGASLASGFLFSIPFPKKANRIKHNVITDYNTRF